MTRADAWITFAAGAYARGAYEPTEVIAKLADQMLEEFDKRWEEAFASQSVHFKETPRSTKK